MSLRLTGLLLCLARLATPALAADGDLDPTFGGSASGVVQTPVGIVETPIGGFSETAEGVALQSDGRGVVIGPTNNGADTTHGRRASAQRVGRLMANPALAALPRELRMRTRIVREFGKE